MKKYLIIVLMLLMTTPCFAAFYIVNSENKIIAIIDYEPDKKDLESRNEIAVFSKDNIAIDMAEYRGGKIVTHKDTAEEKLAKDKKAEKNSEEAMIHERMEKMAYEQLIAEGKSFKHIKAADYENK
jgi:hypothetical protein